MSKNLREKQLKALEESIVLWKHLGVVPEKFGGESEGYKYEMIQKLYNKGLMKKSFYMCACPLCEYFHKEDCTDCPWPGEGKLRCCADSCYCKWYDNEGPAEDVLDLLRDTYQKLLAENDKDERKFIELFPGARFKLKDHNDIKLIWIDDGCDDEDGYLIDTKQFEKFAYITCKVRLEDHEKVCEKSQKRYGINHISLSDLIPIDIKEKL